MGARWVMVNTGPALGATAFRGRAGRADPYIRLFVSLLKLNKTRSLTLTWNPLGTRGLCLIGPVARCICVIMTNHDLLYRY